MPATLSQITSFIFGNSKAPRWMHVVMLLLLTGQFAFSQAVEENYISGKVTDSATGKPVPGCSVYISNTSKGDVSSATGDFILKKLPAGKYELVISAIGYETTVISVSSNNYPHALKIGLHIRSAELSEVTVHPFLTNGWEKWGQTFLNNFIGTIPNAANCHLKNPAVIKFWFSEKNNRLTARAEEPLIIENEALGYIIKFKLETFSLDFNAKMIIYLGYPFFQEMSTTKTKKENRWKENRRDAFYGSLLDFMRCVYNDRWLEAGYNIVTYAKVPNLEKLRAISMMQTLNDSTAYLKKILKQPDSLPVYLSLMHLDSMLITMGDQGKNLFFSNKLKILYRRYPKSKPQESEIYLATPEPITVQANGSYTSAKELVMGMHWALSEKIANMLPFDYQPQTGSL